MANEWGDNKDITYFGKTNFRSTDQVFGIRRKDRRQHMYVLGKSGTGKSVLLSNLIIQNIKNGEGVCVIDPHGELVQEILASIPPERVKDTIYFNPGDIDYHVGFNVLELEDPNYKHLVASGIMGIFTKIWANAWSSRMEYILNNAILALLDTPGSTLLGIPRLLVDKDYRQTIISNLKDPVVRAFWIHEYEAWRDQFRNEAIAPIQNKVGQFLSTAIVRNVVGQSKSTIDVFNIMNSGKIFLVNVSKGRVGEDNSALLGGMLITKIQLAAMERVRIPEDQRKDFYLYVDEFQNFVTDSFANILSEARKYRLNLTIAHQYIGQLETETGSQVRDAVFGNVGTMIVFRVGATDADFLEKEFDPEFAPQDFVNLPNYHIYLKLMVDGIASRPFSASTLPPIKVEHSEEIVQKVVETSRALYMRPRKEVEDEITRWSMATGGKVDENQLDGNGNKVPILMSQTEGGKFEAKCSSCSKDIKVPFEPQAGRPVYCRDCLEKIKSGEMSPVIVTGPKTKKMEERASDALAALGIEFTTASSRGGSQAAPTPKPPQNTYVQKTVPSDMPRPKTSGVDRAAAAVSSPVRPTAPSVSRPPSASPNPAPTASRPLPPKAVSQPVVDIRKKTADVAGLKSALQSALTNVGLTNAPVKKEGPQLPPNIVKPVERPVPKETVTLDSLKPSASRIPINTKNPTEKNLSALKDVLAAAMKDIPKRETPTVRVPVVSPPVNPLIRVPIKTEEPVSNSDVVDEQKQKEAEAEAVRIQEQTALEQKRLAEEKIKQDADLAAQKKLDLAAAEAEERLQKAKEQADAAAEATRLKAEADRAIAESERVRAEEVKRQAELEAKRKEEESRIAEEKRKADLVAADAEAEKQKREEARLIEEKAAAEQVRIQKEMAEKVEAEALKQKTEELERQQREAEAKRKAEEAQVRDAAALEAKKRAEDEEALRIVREKARQFAEEEARMKQEEFQKKETESQSAQTNSQQQTQSYTPRQPAAEVPEDVLKKILE